MGRCLIPRSLQSWTSKLRPPLEALQPNRRYDCIQQGLVGKARGKAFIGFRFQLQPNWVENAACMNAMSATL